MLTANLPHTPGMGHHTPGMSESPSESRGYTRNETDPAVSGPSSAPAAPLSSTPPPLNSSTPLLVYPDPHLLSLKSAAYEALAEIFARKDADLRDKRLAAAIVLKYAASIERTGSPTVRKGSSASPSTAAITDDFSTDTALTDLELPETQEVPARTRPISSPSVPSVLSVPSRSRSSTKTKSSPPPPPQPVPIPPDWLNELRPEEVKLSPFAETGKIPRHITDNHHVQHLQRLCYNHGYWTGFHNYKGTQRPPYLVNAAAPAPGSSACNPTSPLGLIRPALAAASLAADLITRAGTTHPPP